MSEIEEYLRETGCDMLTFREHLISGFPVGTAFVNTLNNWDILQLRVTGMYDDLREESVVDSPRLLEAISYLKEQS